MTAAAKNPSHPVTLVTAIYERQPGDELGGRGRPLDFYFDSLARLAHLGAPWVIYTDPDHVERIATFATSLKVPTEIVARRLDTVPLFYQIQRIREEQDVVNKPFRDRCHALCFGKMNWLRAEAASPRFGSDFVYWVDAGLAHEVLFPRRLRAIPEHLYHPRVLSALTANGLTLLGHPVAGAMLHNVSTETMTRLVGLTRPLTTHVVGGLFGGPRQQVAELAEEFAALHGTLLNAGLLGTEENVLSLIAMRRADWPVVEFESWYHEDTDHVKVPPGTRSFHTLFERWTGLDAQPTPPAAQTAVAVMEWPFQPEVHEAPAVVAAVRPPRITPFAGDSDAHFDRIWTRIEQKIPTVVARYADGEQLLMEGGVVSRNSQVGIEDGWWSDGGMTRLGRDLLATLHHREPEYLYAIPGHNDFASADFYLDRLSAAAEQLTFSTVFINRNYSRFRTRLDSLDEGAVVIASRRGEGRSLGNLRVIEYVPVADDCVRLWEHEHEAETARAIDLARRCDNTLFFIAAGPMSKLWIHTMYGVNPSNRYIDVGSALDELLFGRKTRPYMHPGTQFAEHISRFEGPAESAVAFPPVPHVEPTPAPPPALMRGRPSDVTVVLNTYKRPHTLRPQYESVMNQTRTPADVLIWQNHPAPGDAVRVDPAAFDADILRRCHTAQCINANFGVWARFAFALNSRTKYVCMLDDDTIPGARWLENCLQTIETHRGLLGTVGIIQMGDSFGAHRRVGWCAPNEAVVRVDYVGHAWFFEREWLTAFWRELPDTTWFAYDREPYALCAGEDMHFSYVLQKYLGLGTYVPPHPPGDRSLWGSDPELAVRYGTDDTAVSNLRGPHVKLGAAWAHYRERGFRFLHEG